MHYLITGHTGFKGSWFTFVLRELGHEVSGYSLAAEGHSLYSRAKLYEDLKNEKFADIRDFESLVRFVSSTKPDVLIHFAAQSLVRESYRNPKLTFDVNVLGTLNVLRVLERANSIKAALIITTDKVYLNKGENRAFTESDPLGGTDPYGQSKAIADEISQYWIGNKSVLNTSIVRAGNVIGGGDVCPERLMPELISNYLSGNPPVLRYPDATRPWQHVLDCLNAYLFCIYDLLSGKLGSVWNVGPDKDSQTTVKVIQEMVAINMGYDKNNVEIENAELYESHFLSLDSSKLRTNLNWHNKYNLQETLSNTTDWHLRVNAGEDPKTVTREMVREFLKR